MNAPCIVFVSVAAVVGLLPAFAATEPGRIEGRWNAFDAHTAQKRAVIEIVREGPRVTGRIVELFPTPGEDPDPVCDKCSGAERGLRIRGLPILAVEAERDGQTYRGTVLDPEEGRTYRCVATLLPGGRRLQLRGFVGLELFGRTEVWVRAD